MARVERFFERLVERPTARVFGTQVQPVQVLRRIEREMEAGRRRRGDRSLAPDRFDVRVSADDLAGLGALDGVAEQLASGALAFARSRQLTLSQRPRVSLGADPGLSRGDIEVAAAFSAGVAVPADGADAASGTRVYEAPVVHAPSAALQVAEPGRPARTIDLTARPTLIGRGSDCEVVLADAHASRHHARLEVRGGVFVLTDLGSTNGTRVNGHRVREVVLGVGDRIELGQSTLRVVRPETPEAAA
jgi:Protein of unknown function (DUF3662)/FHA domain